MIFDMDGVLVDSEPMHFRTTNLVLARRGRSVGEAAYAACLGMTELAFFERLVVELAIDEPAEGLASERVAESLRIMSEEPLLPNDGALECLVALRAEGFRLALASSATRAQVGLVIERLGLGRTLEAAVSADDVRRGKPDPELFATAAERLGVPAAGCLVIEDAVLGIRAAKAAGMEALAFVGPGLDASPHLLEGALDRLTSLRELTPQALDRFSAGRPSPRKS